jgi:YihY family inner membrane protein
VSTAQLVPETWELDGDDAADTLRRARFESLMKDSITRFRAADGMSHARSLAFATILTIIPGIIAVVGLAAFTGARSITQSISDFLTDVSPGPTGDILTAAIDQGGETSGHGPLPLIVGLVAMFISGATVFGQIERGANRIYGIEEDRPSAVKYGRAVALFTAEVIVGIVLFVLFEVRPSFLRDLDFGGPEWMWGITRVLLGLAIAVPSFALIFKLSPRRHQPSVSWLAVGSMISALLWIASTVGLKLFWDQGDTFGETYGPLAGMIGLCLWAYVIAVGLFIGLSFAAQLEAVRAGCGEPQDEEKVQESEPEAGQAKPQSDDPERTESEHHEPKPGRVRVAS